MSFAEVPPTGIDPTNIIQAQTPKHIPKKQPKLFFPTVSARSARASSKSRFLIRSRRSRPRWLRLRFQLTFVGNGYKIAGIPVFATTAATEGKVLLADMSAITLLFYGPPQLIVDAFSGGKSTTGQTELIVQNYVDSLIRDRSLVVVGSA